MTAKHTPGPWLRAMPNGLRDEITGPDESRLIGQVFVREYTESPANGSLPGAWPEGEANMALILASPDLLALAHQYAEECGDCAGTRVCPDDEPCTACADIWAVIDKAEGRTMKISQREALRLRKRVDELERAESGRRNRWAREYPGGTYLGAVSRTPDWITGRINAARMLKHAVVVTQNDRGDMAFYALPLGEP